MAIKTENEPLRSKGGSIEYKMSETMAHELLKKGKSNEAKGNPIQYLCRVVNETFGLKSYCTNVIIG